MTACITSAHSRNGLRVVPRWRSQVRLVKPREFLPAAMPGLLGLFTACLLASITGSCSAVMTSASALFTENVYRPLVADPKDSRRKRAAKKDAARPG